MLQQGNIKFLSEILKAERKKDISSRFLILIPDKEFKCNNYAIVPASTYIIDRLYCLLDNSYTCKSDIETFLEGKPSAQLASVWGIIYENHSLRQYLINDSDSKSNKVFVLQKLTKKCCATCSTELIELKPQLQSYDQFKTLDALKLRKNTLHIPEDRFFGSFDAIFIINYVIYCVQVTRNTRHYINMECAHDCISALSTKYPKCTFRIWFVVPHQVKEFSYQKFTSGNKVVKNFPDECKYLGEISQWVTPVG